MKARLLILSVFLSITAFGQWKKVNTDHIDRCVAIDSKICYAMSLHHLWKTTDGGLLWDTVPGFSDSVNFLQIGFSSEKVGYVSFQEGRNAVQLRKTIDGTASFTTINSPPFFYYSQGIQLLDDKIGLFESGGFIHKTLDGGQSFSMFSSGQPQHFGSFHFLNEKEGFMGISDAFPNGVYTKERLIHTSDGGENWDIVYQDTTFFDTVPGREIELSRGIYKINFTDKLHGFAAAGNSTILNTVDGGLHWNVLGRLPDKILYCNDIVFDKGLKVGYVVAYEGAPFGVHSYVYKTKDGGKTWKQDLDLGTGPSQSFFSMIVDDALYVTSFEGLYKIDGILDSIPKNPTKLNFTIYPNPVSKNGNIFIEQVAKDRNEYAVSSFEISLIDISGRVLQEFELNQHVRSIPLVNRSPGVYQLLIKETITGNYSVKKLVIVN